MHVSREYMQDFYSVLCDAINKSRRNGCNVQVTMYKNIAEKVKKLLDEKPSSYIMSEQMQNLYERLMEDESR